MYLFIDTNIYLSFLESKGKDEMKALTELEKLVGKEQVALIFPKVCQDEFIRRIPEVAAEFCKSLSYLNDLAEPPILEGEKELKEKNN